MSDSITAQSSIYRWWIMSSIVLLTDHNLVSTSQTHTSTEVTWPLTLTLNDSWSVFSVWDEQAWTGLIPVLPVWALTWGSPDVWSRLCVKTPEDTWLHCKQWAEEQGPHTSHCLKPFWPCTLPVVSPPSSFTYSLLLRPETSRDHTLVSCGLPWLLHWGTFSQTWSRSRTWVWVWTCCSCKHLDSPGHW